MKTILLAFFALALASCNTSERAPKTLLIKATGEVDATPNKASFSAGLFCLEPTVEASKQCLVEKSNRLIAQLQSLGVSKKDIKTTAVDLNKSYTWRNNSNIFEGYRSSTTLVVTIRDLKALDKIYTALLGNGNLELSGLAYENADFDSLENEAYAIALKKSEVLAGKLLEKLPEDKMEVIRIANVEIQSPEVPMYRHGNAVAVEQASADKSIGMSGGTDKVRATLFVEYAIR